MIRASQSRSGRDNQDPVNMPGKDEAPQQNDPPGRQQEREHRGGNPRDPAVIPLGVRRQHEPTQPRRQKRCEQRQQDDDRQQQRT